MGTITPSDISHAFQLSTEDRPHQQKPADTRRFLSALLILWLAVFVGGLAGPPLMDDADATHAQAARAMLDTGDWVTLHVNGIRYLEKPPLPYWITAVSLKLFGWAPAFAVHLPLALTVLALALLGYEWGRRAFSARAGFYCGLFVLTSAGTFLFTRIFIPDALLALLLALALRCLLQALESDSPAAAYMMWAALALAVLTKGLVAIVFFIGTTIVFLLLSRELRQWKRLRPAAGILLMLGIAAPWHMLAGLRNTGGADGHGFFWFYFINEHVLRFLGRRIPRDYNKLPTLLYWTLHLVWLFPWSLFLPAAVVTAWRSRDTDRPKNFQQRSILLLSIFSLFVLLFFSASTNQEYYTLPVYLPVLLLTAAALDKQQTASEQRQKTTTFAYLAFLILGLCITTALACGLWSARQLPYVPDIGALLAHRGVGDYTLSMSHFFDLTGPSFAALRLPASLAAVAFAVGPVCALVLYLQARYTSAILAVATTSAVFLVAAHLALIRFTPMLSSANFAAKVQQLHQGQQIEPQTQVLLYGDQAYGSSIPFYLHQQVELVEGRSTSMLFGSTFPDAPPIFLTQQQLAKQWGNGNTRHILFVPLELRAQVDHLLGPDKILLEETSGKALYTDRPLHISTGAPSIAAPKP